MIRSRGHCNTMGTASTMACMAEALGTTIPGLAGTPAPDRYCGNLAPSGAVIKPAAASPSLLRHRGRAVVFDSIEDMHHRIDDPDLEADEDSVLVLRGCGPKGYPGMPEVANRRCRPGCSGAGSGTWCASAMAG